MGSGFAVFHQPRVVVEHTVAEDTDAERHRVYAAFDKMREQIERITREAAILHEIETYNRLVPGDHELSATVLIEIEEKADRETFLFEAKGLDRAFALLVDGARCGGKHDEAREHPDRTTAVHYLKFPLEPKAEAALRAVLGKSKKASEVAVELVVEHPRYSAKTTLPASLVQQLAEDLA
jgi:hypothetical protein